MPTPQTWPRSLVWATDLQVLPASRVVERREGYLVVRSPENPLHHWGNFLLFDGPPASGDGERWEQLFEAEFSATPGVDHRAFGWEGTDAAEGEARAEFAARGYELEQLVGLLAAKGGARAHPRENREVTIAPLDPRPGAEPELWEQVMAIWSASSEEEEPGDLEARRAFVRRRLGELRALFVAGSGSWYVALEGDPGEVVGCCGIVAAGPVGRFQSVDTRADRRRRGICSRLVVEACRHSERHYGVERFVLVADAGYHALGLYESLGFEPVERIACVKLDPTATPAGGTAAAAG
ncbi:MAG TPA: GNAT family N-acetyltransferase [Solirubrobacteraceae bacterium]|nr:GNAT family N-acetyltransferase [Solirubrobacteraceae bacterium]